MTLYECSSLIVSALALALSLLIPFCQFIHRKSQKAKLEIIPFDGYPLTLLLRQSRVRLSISNFPYHAQSKTALFAQWKHASGVIRDRQLLLTGIR